MKVNWRIRLKDPTFWVTLVPELILCIQAVLYVFDVSVDLSDLGNRVVAAIDAVFIVLTTLGIIRDPTTGGLGDSELAMTYTTTKRDH